MRLTALQATGGGKVWRVEPPNKQISPKSCYLRRRVGLSTEHTLRVVYLQSALTTSDAMLEMLAMTCDRK